MGMDNGINKLSCHCFTFTKVAKGKSIRTVCTIKFNSHKPIKMNMIISCFVLFFFFSQSGLLPLCLVKLIRVTLSLLVETRTPQSCSGAPRPSDEKLYTVCWIYS